MSEGFEWGVLGCGPSCEVDLYGCGNGPEPMVEQEPNDSAFEALVLAAPSLGRGAVNTAAGDEEDWWAVEVVPGHYYRVWTSNDLDGGCSIGEDGALSIESTISIVHRNSNDDIDPPDNRCPEAEFKVFSSGVVHIGVSAWSPTFSYYIWLEKLDA